jgi:hypothetical protein
MQVDALHLGPLHASQPGASGPLDETGFLRCFARGNALVRGRGGGDVGLLSGLEGADQTLLLHRNDLLLKYFVPKTCEQGAGRMPNNMDSKELDLTLKRGDLVPQDSWTTMQAEMENIEGLKINLR